ncbi:MAG: MotA/TolQ/ExbB proton channel family protein [Cytophagales bacterium]|nr:MotA/TolQ/ExbB proton channel family protein [Cytophagales bacterium]
MIELFLQGGVLFMSIITIFLVMVGLSFYTHSDKLKTYGSLALSSGVLGSFIGLYSAFMTIQEVGNVSPSVFAGGLRVALICTLYGLLVYVISRVLHLFR